MRNTPTGRRAAAASSGWLAWRRGPSVPVYALQARPNVSQSVSQQCDRCAAGRGRIARMRLGLFGPDSARRAKSLHAPFQRAAAGTERFDFTNLGHSRRGCAEHYLVAEMLSTRTLCNQTPARRVQNPPTGSSDAREACWATSSRRAAAARHTQQHSLISDMSTSSRPVTNQSC